MKGGILERVERSSSSTLVRARAGDVAAFETLYRRHSGMVFAICQRMAGDRAEAEDWAQDAWIRAWERLDGFRGDSKFSTWLHRLTVNLILDRRRKDGRWRHRIVEKDDGERSKVQASWDSPPGARMDLERAVGALPDGARTVFLLHEVEGYKQREIGERLGITVGTVKSQLHRARQLLQEALSR